MKKQISNVRTSLTPLFARIARESNQNIQKSETEIKKLEKLLLKSSEGDSIRLLTEEIESQTDHLAQQAFVTIVFSAMAIESYIYDYAARHLTDEYTHDHLDKLDTVSKWVVIPSLVTGKELPSNEKWLELLKNLIKVRNSIIHYKSSKLPSQHERTKAYMEKLDRSEKFILDTARQSILLLDILADKISEIDPKETPWVQAYLS